MNRDEFWGQLVSGEFASLVREATKGRALSRPRDVYNVMKPLVAREPDVEQVWIISLDAQNRVLAIERLSRGSIGAAPIFPRELVKMLLARGATAVILCHNHPSGDATPSGDDVAATMRAGLAAACIDVTLHDHIIIGEEGNFTSLQETKGIADEVKERYKAMLR